MNLSFAMLVFSLHYYKTYMMCYFYREKKVGVLVVSLRGVNLRFWSRLGY